MNELEHLRGLVIALLRETELGTDFDERAITNELRDRYGLHPPDPIPDFWAIADRHRAGFPPGRPSPPS